MIGGMTNGGPRRIRLAVVAAGTAVALMATGACSFVVDRTVDPIASPTAVTTPDGSANGAVPPSLTSSPSPTTDPSKAVQEAAADLNAHRLDALANKDRGGWTATLADGSNPFGVAQAALFDGMVKMPLSRLSTRSVLVKAAADNTTRDATTVGAVWVADLDLGYEFVGYDTKEREYRLSYLMTRTVDGWRFSGTGPDANDPQPFDLAGVQVLSSPSTLVIGNVPAATMRAFLAVGNTGRDRVAAIWGEAVPSVLVLPKTVDEMAEQLGAKKGDFDQVAGATAGPRRQLAPAGSDRVFINPDASSQLTQVGRQAIVSHELTHVTTRATTAQEPPTWLSEGFADYVGLKGSGLSTTAVASALLDQVRDGKVPTALPSETDFDPAKSTIEPAYNQAWLAIMLMQRKYGDDKVVAFYRAVCGTPTAAPPGGTTADDLAKRAFETVLGTTQDEFVKEWIAYVTKLAR